MASRSKLLGKAVTWQDTVDLKVLLEGESVGNSVWQAQQTLDSLSKTHPNDERVVYLTSHLHMAKTLQEPLPPTHRRLELESEKERTQ